MRVVLVLLLLVLPCLADEYPPVLVDVLGYDVLRHHFAKDEKPVFSVLGGGRRNLMTCRLVEVPDSTQRAAVVVDSSRRVVRVSSSATRVYDLRGSALSLDSLVKGGSYVLAYYDAAEPVVTDIVSLEPVAPEETASGKARTLPVTVGGVRVSPPVGWQVGSSGDLVPRVYRGKLRPHLFVSRGSLESAATGLTEIASHGPDRLFLWTFEDKVLTVRLRACQDGVVVALFCLLEDYREWAPGFRELVGNLDSR